MALLKIVKDGKALIIPHGAYRTQYAPAGWVIEKPDGLKKPSKDTEADDTEAPDTEQPDSSVNEATEGDSDEPDDADEDEDDDYYTLLEETPLSELDLADLRALAEHRGIDITGITSAKKIREAIQTAK